MPAKVEKVIIPCTYCGKEISKLPSRAKKSAGKNCFCDNKCQGAWAKENLRTRIVVQCAYCGKDIKKKPYETTEHRKHFCNKVCRLAYGGSMEVPCYTCGKPLKRTAHQIKNIERHFCGLECRAEWNKTLVGPLSHRYKKVVRQCANCGKDIERSTSKGKNKNLFCNHECFCEYKGKSTEVPCTFCGKPLTRQPNAIKNRKRHFCDLVCRGEWMKTQTGALALHYENKKVQVPCCACGKLLLRDGCEVRDHERQFCNKKCHAVWQDENTHGINSNSWKGGHFNYYGPYWDERKREIRQRDGYRCQSCGESHHYKKPLHVHHIKPFKSFNCNPEDLDSYSTANAPENLISLCSSCHRKIHNGTLSLWRPASVTGDNPVTL